MTHGIANDKDSSLTQEKLREVLRYNRRNGVFTWVKNTGKKRLIGAVAGNLTKGYWEIGLFGRQYKAHRLAWLYVIGKWPPRDLDHKNQNKLDNRFSNLREATRSQNNINRSAASKYESGRIGVCWHSQSDKWRAYITVEGRQISLGLFDGIGDAISARENAEIFYYGEYARAA
jgi:hypothetical protein